MAQNYKLSSSSQGTKGKMAKEMFPAIEKTGKRQVNYADHVYLTFLLVCAVMNHSSDSPKPPIKDYDL